MLLYRHFPLDPHHDRMRSYLFGFRQAASAKHGFTAEQLAERIQGATEEIVTCCLAKFTHSVPDEVAGAEK